MFCTLGSSQRALQPFQPKTKYATHHTLCCCIRDLHLQRQPKQPPAQPTQPPSSGAGTRRRWHPRWRYTETQQQPPSNRTNATHPQPTHTAHTDASEIASTPQRYYTKSNPELTNPSTTQPTPPYIHTIVTQRNATSLPHKQRLPHKYDTHIRYRKEKLTKNRHQVTSPPPIAHHQACRNPC